MSTTPNLGLTKPAIDSTGWGGDVNTNWDTLDTNLPKSNFSASAAPTVNDDTSAGYAVGSRWFDTTNSKAYVCLFADASTATWKETTAEVEVSSVFGRTGAVVAQPSDYDASQVDNDSAVTGSTVKDALDTLDTAVDSLTDDSMADSLHRHSELSGSDGSPNPALSIDADGNLSLMSDTDATAVFGRAKIGYTNSDQATFAHIDNFNTTDYALKQTDTGRTDINAKTGQDILFKINDTTKMVLDQDGNVGIGESNPQGKLHISGDNVAVTTPSTGADELVISNQSDNTGISIMSANTDNCNILFGDPQDNNVGYISYQHATNLLNIGVNAATRMVIDSNGNIGIGTTSPIDIASSKALTISDSSKASLFFEDTGYEATGNGLCYFSYDSGLFYLYSASRSGTGTTGTNEIMRINAGGALGWIGIGDGGNPQYQVDVYENLNSYTCRLKNDHSNASGLRIQCDSSSSSSYYAIYCSSGAGSPFYAKQNGTVYCNILTKGSGTFTIDHPLDPANKLLQHSFVESPEMRNVYYGQATLKHGKAIVKLPDWWRALNGEDKAEFNYQLTCIGGYTETWISKEVEDGVFEISGNADLTISWTLSAIRHDAHAEQNRVKVEVDKPEAVFVEITEEVEEADGIYEVTYEEVHDNTAKGFYLTPTKKLVQPNKKVEKKRVKIKSE